MEQVQIENKLNEKWVENSNSYILVYFNAVKIIFQWNKPAMNVLRTQSKLTNCFAEVGCYEECALLSTVHSYISLPYPVVPLFKRSSLQVIKMRFLIIHIELLKM